MKNINKFNKIQRTKEIRKDRSPYLRIDKPKSLLFSVNGDPAAFGAYQKTKRKR